MNKRRLIIGDVHGRYNALLQVLERAHFSENEDILYSVGDFCDRGRGNVEVVRYLSSLPDFRPVLGNHDAWLQDYLRYGCSTSENWVKRNGGDRTIASFERLSDDERKSLSSWLDNIPYCRIEDDIILVHGGPIGRDLSSLLRTRDYGREEYAKTIPDELWDRIYLRTAFLTEEWEKSSEKNDGMSRDDYMEKMNGAYDELGDETRCGEKYCPYPDKMLFVGHSIVGEKPFVSDEFRVTAIDTGAAYSDGKLTCYDIDSGKYWQSDEISKTEEI